MLKDACDIVDGSFMNLDLFGGFWIVDILPFQFIERVF